MKVYLSMYAIKKTSKKRQAKFFCSNLDTSPLYFVSQKYSINSFFWNYKKIFDRLIITFITLVAIRNNYFFFNASIFFLWFLFFISPLFQKNMLVLFIIFIFTQNQILLLLKKLSFFSIFWVAFFPQKNLVWPYLYRIIIK